MGVEFVFYDVTIPEDICEVLGWKYYEDGKKKAKKE